MKLRSIVHALSKLRGILRILGVKDKTAIAKGAQVIEEIDKALPPEAPKLLP